MALTSTLHVCADRLGLLTAVLCAAAAGSKDLVVFYETVQALARSAITLADLPEILGITLAHEIGHLLLGPGTSFGHRTDASRLEPWGSGRCGKRATAVLQGARQKNASRT